MNGKQILKAIEKFREECDDAYSDSKDFPVIEAAIPIDAQKRIAKRYGDVVANLLTSINEKIEALNEAQSDLDCDLELLEYIATGIANSEQLEQQLADITQPAAVDAVPVAGEANAGDDSHKVKGD